MNQDSGVTSSRTRPSLHIQTENLGEHLRNPGRSSKPVQWYTAPDYFKEYEERKYREKYLFGGNPQFGQPRHPHPPGHHAADTPVPLPPPVRDGDERRQRGRYRESGQGQPLHRSRSEQNLNPHRSFDPLPPPLIPLPAEPLLPGPRAGTQAEERIFSQGSQPTYPHNPSAQLPYYGPPRFVGHAPVVPAPWTDLPPRRRLRDPLISSWKKLKKGLKNLHPFSSSHNPGDIDWARWALPYPQPVQAIPPYPYLPQPPALDYTGYPLQRPEFQAPQGYPPEMGGHPRYYPSWGQGSNALPHPQTQSDPFNRPQYWQQNAPPPQASYSYQRSNYPPGSAPAHYRTTNHWGGT